MLSLSQTPLTHSTPLTRHCHALAERRHLHHWIQLNRINHSHQQSVKQPPSQANQAISHDQSISQSINTQPQQSFNHSHHTIQPHLYLSHTNSNDLSFSANHSFSLAANHSVNSHCYCTMSCTFSHSREMHTSHNNIAHSNLWLTGYTLTEFCMLLCLIPSVTLQVSHGDVTASQSLMQPLLRSITLHGLFLSLMQLSRNLSRNNLRSIHLCYSLNLCASCAPMLSHDCYLTSHLFRAQAPSHDSLALSPFLTQLSIPIPISHAIFARSLTLPIALLISRAISVACSHTCTQGVAEPGGLRHGLVLDRSWRSMIDPTTLVHTHCQ